MKLTILGNSGGVSAGPREVAFNEIGQFLLGDVDGDGIVNLFDVAPFVRLISTGIYQANFLLIWSLTMSGFQRHLLFSGKKLKKKYELIEMLLTDQNSLRLLRHSD